jgi:hypothetical protein
MLPGFPQSLKKIPRKYYKTGHSSYTSTSQLTTCIPLYITFEVDKESLYKLNNNDTKAHVGNKDCAFTYLSDS